MTVNVRGVARNQEITNNRKSVSKLFCSTKDDWPYDWERGGRYFDDVAGKMIPRRRKNPDEQVEKDSVCCLPQIPFFGL